MSDLEADLVGGAEGEPGGELAHDPQYRGAGQEGGFDGGGQHQRRRE